MTPSIQVAAVVKKARLLRAKIKSLKNSSAKKIDTTKSTLSIADTAVALACAFSDVGVRYDCNTKLTHDQMENKESRRFSTASIRGFRKRNDERIRRNECDSMRGWKGCSLLPY